MTENDGERPAEPPARPKRTALAHIRSARDVAFMLETNPAALTYALFRAEPEERYRTFEIPKRSGGARRIDAPTDLLRPAQDKLLEVMTGVIEPHPAANGFLHGRNVRTNADPHVGARLVLNVDLKDFFPTINFGRVRGLFMASPFGMAPAAATVCAQLCTFRNGLPQGAPTSPILSNFIAAGLDRRLGRLARRSRMRYSRYADDITFSTNAARFPSNIVIVETLDDFDADALAADASAGVPADSGAGAGRRPEDRAEPRVRIGGALESEIRQCGFEANPAKVRLQGRHVRQSVTGVVVNAKANLPRKRVRKIRAMVRAWREFGLDAAGRAHLAKRASETGGVIGQRNAPGRVFRNALYGELAYLKMVRGEDDAIFRKFAGQLLEIDPNPPKSLRRLAFGADDFEVFISHASEDKEAIARPIADACAELGIKVFLDEAQIAWGDGFVAKINAALGAARVVLAVVSDHSVTKDWPLAEMNTALQLEVEGDKTVVALMVGRPDLAKLPMMRRKAYTLWRDDPKTIAHELAALLRPPAAPSPAPVSAPPLKAPSASPSWPAARSDAQTSARRGLMGRLFGRRDK